MSLRHEVLIRILVLLQRKTLLETKNRTLKSLKPPYSTVQSMKNVAVLTEDRAFAVFFRPHHGGFDSSRVPTPRNLPSKAKKMLTPGGQPGRGGGGGWVQLELTDALPVKHKCTPKRYQNLVLQASPKLISTPMRYQFNNNKLYNRHCKFQC